MKKYLLILLILSAGCTTARRDVEVANRKVDKITEELSTLKAELSSKIEQQNVKIDNARTVEVVQYKALVSDAANSNWMTINALGLVRWQDTQLETLVLGHAYTTQEYLGTPSVATLRTAASKNAALLASTREELDKAIEAQKAEAAARVAAVNQATLETKKLIEEKQSIEKTANETIIKVQEERFTWQQKATKFLKEALENAESKKELAKYVLKICVGVSSALIIAGIVGLYFFKSPRFAAYCTAGAGLLFTFGWFFVNIPPWLMIALLITVVVAVPAVLIHGYLHGKKTAVKEISPTVSG